MAKSNLLEWANYYTKQGFSIIPVVPGGKNPAVPWTEYQKRKPTPEELAKWFTTGNYNIGIVTGRISNLAVVDIDTDEGRENIAKYIPDSLVTPTVSTPRGGQHLYFTMPDVELRNNAGLIPGCDLRAEGGFITAPPSVNGNGVNYKWVITPTDARRAIMPLSYINKISLYKGDVTQEENPSQNVMGHAVTFSLTKGNRDESLFYTANALIRGGATPQIAEIILNTLAKNCKPPFPESEISAKIASVLERASRKERNLHAEISNWVSVTSGDFNVTQCDKELSIVTSRDMATRRKIFQRLKEAGIIEKVGKRDGQYRRIETNLNFIAFDDSEEVPFPVQLPFGMHDMVEISAGNIILIGGEFNSGKSTACIEILRMNKNRVPIRYISSEVSTQSEFKKRFRGYRGIPLSFWMPDEMTDYVSQSSDFAHSLKPGALNIIDYLEFSEGDFTTGAEALRQIHDKLEGGVAVVAVQKKKGSRLPRSGDLIMEKPRLAITLSSLDEGMGVAEIVKAKICKGGKHDGKKLKFEIVEHGSTFKIINDWGFLRL